MKKIALGTLAALSEGPEGHKWSEWKAKWVLGPGKRPWGLSPPRS